MSEKLRWGILSTAKIATHQVIPAIQQSETGEVVAICSRDLSRAKEAAQKLGIPHAYGSYEELLDDPNIDAVYNPLPNHLHVDWSIRSLEAGKHVLCEKPLGLSVNDALRLLEASECYSELKVMEAFMYRHHPQWQYAMELIRSGRLGRLCAVNSLFSYYNRKPDDIRNQAALGGGGLMDIGCYPISLSRFVFQSEPLRVIGTIENDPDFQVDRLASALLDFGTGIATMTCSTQMVPYQRVNLLGTEGRYEIEIPFNAPIDRPCRAWLQLGQEVEEILFPVCNQYTIQADLFAKSVFQQTPVPTPLTDALCNLQVIEAIRESAIENRWVERV